MEAPRHFRGSLIKLPLCHCKKNGRIPTKNDEEKNFTVFQVRAGSIGVNQYGRRDAYIVGQFLCIHSSPVSLGFSNNLS